MGVADIFISHSSKDSETAAAVCERIRRDRTLFFEDRGDAHTGPVTNMTTEPAGLSAAIIAVQALSFLILAYVVTLLRFRGPRAR